MTDAMPEDEAVRLYRKTSLGKALADTLEEMAEGRLFAPVLSDLIRSRFDESMKEGLSRLRNSITIHAKCDSFQTCLSLSDFQLRNVRFSPNLKNAVVNPQARHGFVQGVHDQSDGLRLVVMEVPEEITGKKRRR